MALNIPNFADSAFRVLLKYTDADWKMLIDALKATKPTLYPEELANGVAKTSKLDQREVQEVFSVLAGISRARPSRVSLAEFSEDICHALKVKNKEGLSPSDGNWDRLRQGLIELLSHDGALALTAAAADLISDYEHSFNEGSVLTDLRPIFIEGASSAAAGAIVHLLKLGYADARGERSDFYVALDSRDVRNLIRELERGLLQEKSVKSLVKGIQILEPPI